MNNGENLTNVGEIVGIVLTVLAIFIIVLSILVGIKRGMKKSLFRLGWLFVTALILWFVTPPISNLLNTIDLTSLNLDIMGPVHRLSDIGVNILNQVVQGVGDAELANILSSSTALNSFAENLPTLLINIVLFVVLFFVTKYLLWPIYALISSKINWQPYMEMIIKAAQDGTEIPYDYCPGIEEGAVELTELNTAVAAPGTQEAIDAAKEQLVAGTLHVFDTSKFTVEGKTLDSYMADVDTDDAFTPDTEVVSDGYFHESEKRSAPYFDIKYIDGISEK